MRSSKPKPKSGPDASLHNMAFNQPRPPSSSGPTGHVASATFRASSAMRRQSLQETSRVSVEDLPDTSTVRPPSSFSKYRPLPAIGTPVPEDDGTDMLSSQHHGNPYIKPKLQQHSKSNSRHHETYTRQQSSGVVLNTRTSRQTVNSNVLPDFSPSQTNSTLQRTLEVNTSIERLDLSQLDNVEATWKRKPSHTDHSHRKLKSSFHTIQRNTSDTYDGDDDDSDTTESPVSGYDSGVVVHTPGTSAAVKPVVIPSPESPPSKEVLLAVKLPTDGTRHQKYFKSSDTLQAILDYAELIAGKSFRGYVLVVASAPKTVYVDLEDTIENAGLEDKTVFHLEEYEWED